jgi:hypothetical protein
MHGPINVKSPNNINRWQMGFNSAFKGLNKYKDMKTDEGMYAQLHTLSTSVLHGGK